MASCYETVPVVGDQFCDSGDKLLLKRGHPDVAGKKATFILLAIFTTSLTMLFIVYLNFPHLDEYVCHIIVPHMTDGFHPNLFF